MYPVLLSLGPLTISSFGFFLAIAILSAIFIVWRLARAYDVKEEKIIDAAILTVFGALIGARVYFVLTHLSFFNEIRKVLLVNLYPGLSFWGGLVGAVIALAFFASRLRLNFWQMADFAAAGAALGMVVGNIGCFVGGCAYGIVLDSPISAPVAGLLGKRLPVQLIESLVLFLVFYYLWKQVVRFHFNGKIVSLLLIFLGLEKLLTEFYRGDSIKIFQNLAWGHLWSTVIVILGIVFFYLRSKRSVAKDLGMAVKTLTSVRGWGLIYKVLKKKWYNSLIHARTKSRKSLAFIKSLPRIIRRRLNVKPTPQDIN